MDLNFHVPNIQDKEEFDYILKGNSEFSSEYAFGTQYLWTKAYNIQICIYNNIIFKKYIMDTSQVAYSFPYCKGDKSEALKVIYDYTKSKGEKLRFIGITEQSAYELDKLMTGRFNFEEDRNSWDYIYKTADLINLKGRKYHSKRNHISKFKKLYNWNYSKITKDNINECKVISNKWFDKKGQKESGEYDALERAFNNYDTLGFLGGIIRVNDEPIAFTMGEEINDSVFLAHFEKAIEEFDGIYSVINNEFCKNLRKYKYVNREEDLGIPGLRKAKLSYNPAVMVKKYKAVIKN